MLNIKMIFLFSATLVILTTTTITTTCAKNVENLQATNRAFNLAGSGFNLPLDDDIDAAKFLQRRAIDDFSFEGIFKRQTINEELIPATSDLEEDVDGGDAGVQQQQGQQEQLGVIEPAAEVANAAEGVVPSPTRIVKTFSNSGLRR